MKTKQSITPGPWRTGDMFNMVFGPKTGAPCPEVIATIHKGNRANAQAIAALPDLIAALQGLTDYYAARWGVDAGAEKVWYAAKDALAKAGIR
ncbi:MAG: hypothetical protein WCC95_18245 [Candidatus Sulfotelmatobacter sp.]